MAETKTAWDRISNHISSAKDRLRTSDHLFPCQETCFLRWCSEFLCSKRHPWNVSIFGVLSVVPAQMENVWFYKYTSTHIVSGNLEHKWGKRRTTILEIAWISFWGCANSSLFILGKSSTHAHRGINEGSTNDSPEIMSHLLALNWGFPIMWDIQWDTTYYH